MEMLDESLRERISRHIEWISRNLLECISEKIYNLDNKISNEDIRQKVIDTCIDAVIDYVKPYVKDAYEYLINLKLNLPVNELDDKYKDAYEKSDYYNDTLLTNIYTNAPSAMNDNVNVFANNLFCEMIDTILLAINGQEYYYYTPPVRTLEDPNIDSSTIEYIFNEFWQPIVDDITEN